MAFMTFGDAAERAAFEKLVAAFAERAPGIHVTLVHVPGQSDYRRRLGVDFAAGTPADIVLLNYRRYASFAARGVLEPLGPYLAEERVIKEADFYPEPTTPFAWQGELMCIPQNLSSLVVYYNRDLFRAAGSPIRRTGWTWDDLPARGAGADQRHRRRRPIDQYGLGTEVSIFRVAPFIWQNGGDLVDNPQRRPGSPSTPPQRARRSSGSSTSRWHKVAPDAAAEKAESSESRFLNGRLAMFLNSRRGVPT